MTEISTEPTERHFFADPVVWLIIATSLVVFVALPVIAFIQARNQADQQDQVRSEIEETYGATLVSKVSDLPLSPGESARLDLDLPPGPAQCRVTIGDVRDDVTLLCGPTLTEPARR